MTSMESAERAEIEPSWLDHWLLKRIGDLASIASVGLLLGILAVLLHIPPAEDELEAVSGDVVVLESCYAHIITSSGPLKITYSCGCGHCLQPWMREGEHRHIPRCLFPLG